MWKVNLDLEKITHTTSGYEVKDLIYKERDNMITGRVKCPVRGKKTLHDGFIGCGWNIKGKPLAKHGGKDRNDLNLEL